MAELGTLVECVDCLQETLGIYCENDTEGGCGGESAPLYFVSDLPGINLRQAVNIADHETPKGVDLINRAIRFCSSLVVNDFLDSLAASEIIFVDQISDQVVGCHGEAPLSRTGLLGVEIEMTSCNDRYIRGYVEYIELRSFTAVPGVVFIQTIDGVLELFTADLNIGINRIRIDRTFKEQYRVVTDFSLLSISDGTSGSTGKCYSCPCYSYCGCLTINGVEETPSECVTDGVCLPSGCIISPDPMITYLGTTNGIVIATACKAHPEELVCQYRKELAPALLYRVGAHLIETQLSSDRANPLVRNTREEAKELYDKWMGVFSEVTGFTKTGEYQKYLNRVVSIAKRQALMTNSRAFVSSGLKIAPIIKTPFKGKFGNKKRY